MFQPNLLKRHRHLIYIHNATIETVEITKSRHFFIDRVDFLVNETENSIDLVTAFMFSPGVCRENKFRVVDRFTRYNRKWENQNFFVEKYKNLHGCPINFANHSGHLVLEKIFANTLNFDYRVNNQRDALAFYYIQSSTYEHIDGTFVVNIETKMVYIPPGELYGNYEKMFLPFDAGAWIAIGVTILTVFLGILVIKMFSKRVQDRIFGRNNSSPCVNFISILLNGSQISNLDESWPRFFMILFVLWSLIIR
jgi:hypothetical protein